MGQLFKIFKRYNYRLSTFLNISKNCSFDPTMTGMKIAIIFFAIAMISATANAAPHDVEECVKTGTKMCNGDMECIKLTTERCKFLDGVVNGEKLRKMALHDNEECAKKMRACNGNSDCVLRVMKECGIECNEQGNCTY